MQTIIIKASPEEVYSSLMNSKKHSKFTGYSAKISNKIEGKFTVYGGYIEGKNVILIKNKKIVQYWRGTDDSWPKNYFSKVTFLLEKVKNSTKLIFTHSGVPTEAYKDIKQGWKEYYWDPMKKFLEK